MPLKEPNMNELVVARKIAGWEKQKALTAFGRRVA
jgi:hypothetical protein